MMASHVNAKVTITDLKQLMKLARRKLAEIRYHSQVTTKQVRVPETPVRAHVRKAHTRTIWVPK